MEPEVAEFLKKISYTIGLVIAWLVFNVVFGIKLYWGHIINGSISFGNIFYYLVAVISLLFIIRTIYKWWANFKLPQ
jgi:membrane protein YdbS with pleckstrin-like domain